MNKKILENFVQHNLKLGDTMIINCNNKEIKLRLDIDIEMEYEEEYLYVKQQKIEVNSTIRISMIPYDKIVSIDILTNE